MYNHKQYLREQRRKVTGRRKDLRTKLYLNLLTPAMVRAWPEERILSFLASYKERASGCWEWIKQKDAAGYGRIELPRAQWGDRYRPVIKAHRFSVAYHGTKIPAGMMVDHLCRNKSCVRPDHLRVVTPGTNALENSNSLQARYKARTHCQNGHEYAGDNLRIKIVNGTRARMCRQCARENYHRNKP